MSGRGDTTPELTKNQALVLRHSAGPGSRLVPMRFFDAPRSATAPASSYWRSTS